MTKFQHRRFAGRFLGATLAAGAAMTLMVGTAMAQDGQVLSFSAGQATGGGVNFQAHCAACHGTELEGTAAPALTGEGFSAWIGRPVSELHEFIKNQMPADAPGSLTDAQVSTIIAFLASRNGMTAGGPAMPTVPSKLEGIAFAQ